jgi:hypothetical protein
VKAVRAKKLTHFVSGGGDYEKGGWTVSIFIAHFVAKKIGGKATLLPSEAP